MARSTLIVSSVLLGMAVGLAFHAIGRTQAADIETIPVADLDIAPVVESHASTTMRVISDEQTSRTIWLGINKQRVFEFSRDIAMVLVADKGGGGGADKGSTNKVADDKGANGITSGDAGAGQSATDPVKVTALTNRRINIIGVARGHTNVFVYDAKGQQIGGLDILVTNGSPIGPVDFFGRPLKRDVLTIYRGGDKGSPDGRSQTFNCINNVCPVDIPASRDDTDVALEKARLSGANER